ncbi:MAG: type II secretion system protein [Candidatus Moranbacteria bacterium]|nr:type II secretion system protein [Candidatus Moranbacteria bacterium]
MIGMKKMPAKGWFAYGEKTKINSNSGFSVIEVLVTLFVVGLVFVLFQQALGKVHLVNYADDQETALRVANNKIEELRSGGYSALPTSGNFSDSQLNTLSNSSVSMTITDFNTNTKKVVVTIQWRQSAGSPLRNVSLTTLVTKTGGL